MNLEKLKELVKEACNACDAQQKPGFGGEEKASGGRMARTDLVTIAKDAQELVNMFGDDAELPDWVESKLTKASDYLNSVKKYIGGEIVRQHGGLMEEGLSSLKMKQEEQMHALASAATSGMARLKDPAGVHPTVLDYFFEDKEDKMGFLDDFHTEIQRELRHHVEYEERFAKENPAMADKLKKGEEQPSLDLEEGKRSYSSKTTGNYVMPDKGVQLSRSGVRNMMGDKISGVTDISDMGADHNRMVAKAKNQKQLARQYKHKAELKQMAGKLTVSYLTRLKNKFRKMGLKEFPPLDFRENVDLEPIEEEREVYLYLEDATYDDGEMVEEDFEFWSDVVMEAEYQGRKVQLNKPTRGDVKKFKVFVKDPKTGNVKKVNFGDPNMRIKKSNPKRRKSFRARHNCDNPGPKTKARYWSCRKW